MPKETQIDAPLSLGSFFPDSDNEDEATTTEFEQCYETQKVTLANEALEIRQYAYHSHNANRVWPGTFNLCDYLLQTDKDGSYMHHWGNVLELGTATGLLAIRLALASTDHADANPSVCTTIVTSDVDDEYGDVQDNTKYNFTLNGFSNDRMPIHVPHTWGTGWKVCAEKRAASLEFDTIVASDILLYVSAYPALVQTLEELMPVHSNTKFVMSWNRRMKESAEFFDRIKDAGFSCHHEGKCVHTFQRST